MGMFAKAVQALDAQVSFGNHRQGRGEYGVGPILGCMYNLMKDEVGRRGSSSSENRQRCILSCDMRFLE
ncbi:MAG TPA: hypothetical protein ENJ18_13300 [Nannocystis exedens]|nr:hypothetical protein [Nannocystis exedens]